MPVMALTHVTAAVAVYATGLLLAVTSLLLLLLLLLMMMTGWEL